MLGWFGGSAAPPKPAEQQGQLVSVPRARHGESQRPLVPTFNGGCLCGAIKFEIKTEKPQLTMYCHCQNCQKTSGGPVMAWATIMKDELFFTQGKDEISVYQAANAKRRFCKRCGTPLSFQRNDLDEEIDVTISSLEHSEWRPEMHIWAQNAVSWCKVEDSEFKLPRHQMDPATVLRKNQQET